MKEVGHVISALEAKGFNLAGQMFKKRHAAGDVEDFDYAAIIREVNKIKFKPPEDGEDEIEVAGYPFIFTSQ